MSEFFLELGSLAEPLRVPPYVLVLSALECNHTGKIEPAKIGVDGAKAAALQEQQRRQARGGHQPASAGLLPTGRDELIENQSDSV